MKRYFFLAVIIPMLLVSQQATARNLAPLIESIALLKLYMGYVKKGYDIADKGLQPIRDIKNGEFSLHDDYYNSLKNVNPQLKQYDRIAAILKMQKSIVALYNKGRKQVSSNGFDADESRYLIRVYNNLLDESVKEIDELTLVLTDGKLEMKDEERMKRIDIIAGKITEQYQFIHHFNKQVAMVAFSREKEQHDIEYLRKLYNL